MKTPFSPTRPCRTKINLKPLIFITVFVSHMFFLDKSGSTSQCEPCGYPGGGRFTDIQISPHNPLILLAGSDVSGIFKSVDGGKNFYFSSDGLQGFYITSISFHPDKKDIILALTDSGLHLSKDQGNSWHLIDPNIFYKNRCCTGHLISFSRNKAFIGSDKGIFVYDLEVNKSSFIGLDSSKINAVATINDKVLAATDNGIFVYTDSRWQPANEGFDMNHMRIKDVVLHKDGTVYCVEEEKGLYILQGNKWVHKGLGLLNSIRNYSHPIKFKSVAVDPKNSKHVIIGTHPETWPSKVFRSKNSGGTWEELKNFDTKTSQVDLWAKGPSGVETITFSDTPSLIFLTDWWNIWHSSDEGKTWAPCTNGLQNSVVNDIKLDYQNPKRIYLCVADNGFLVSDDEGKSWKRLMRGLPDGHAQEVEISRSNPNKMYLILNPWRREKGKIYVYKSNDGGLTWKDISFFSKYTPETSSKPYVNFETTNIELDPFSDEIIYVATNGRGIYKSLDGGSTWIPIHKGIDEPFVKASGALSASQSEGKATLFVTTLGGGVFKSEDRGDSWKKISSSYNFAFGLAISKQDPNRIAVGLPEKKVLISKDGGSTWKESILPGVRPDHISAYSIAFHPKDPDIIAVGTLAYDFKPADGLFLSHDMGNKFERYETPKNLPQLNLNVIRFSEWDPSYLYIGFNGMGIYKCNLSHLSKDKAPIK